MVSEAYKKYLFINTYLIKKYLKTWIKKQLITGLNINNLKLKTTLLLLLGFVSIPIIRSQCTPPATEQCILTQTLCSINDLNGYTCSNKSKTASECLPDYIGENTDWWAFNSKGGETSITITTGACQKNMGLEFGIMDDCPCGKHIAAKYNPCIAARTIYTLKVNLSPCKIYYLWIDGCGGDLCDFTINTASNVPPDPFPLGYINNDTGRIIQPICSGVCGYEFYISPVKNACNFKYLWTLDGDDLPWNSNRIKLDLPNAGDFTLCVEVRESIGFNNLTCSISGPVCTKLMVRDAKPFPSPPSIYCYENQNSILCCNGGSYHVLNLPEPADVYFISCGEEPYVDMLGRSWPGCRQKFEILFPKSTIPYHCDSSILLTTATINRVIRYWDIACMNGTVQIKPIWDYSKICSVGATLELDYNWYDQSDPLKKTLSTDLMLNVNRSGSYCLNVGTKAELDNQSSYCNKSYCYTINIDSIPGKSILIGKDSICTSEKTNYYLYNMDTADIKQYDWTLSGAGSILTPNPNMNSSIDIQWNSGGLKNVCIRYLKNNVLSCRYCIQTFVKSRSNAGHDQKILGLKTKLAADPNQSGNWKTISGTGLAVFANNKNPNSSVSVTKKGVYLFEWSTNNSICIGKDTVAVEFYTLPKRLNQPILNLLKNQNSQFVQNKLNFEIDFKIKNPVLTNEVFTVYTTTEKHIEPIQYSWIQLVNYSKFDGIIKNLEGTSFFEIQSPPFPGIYLLNLYNSRFQKTIKIIVLDNH